ncbi:hypothetical protein DFH06DRAFT_1134972 [Mycena polygramma]|nr:hypothetical protein DFH06DRAFT_1134972 [Mycena polygramma]
MVPPFLQRLRNDGRLSLAYAIYMEDFIPTRDQSLPSSGSLFTFKRVLPEGEESNATETRRGYLPRYHGVIFGEVADVVPLGENRGAQVCLQAPARATCACLFAYDRQITVLEDVLVRDGDEMGGRVETHWFMSAIGAEGKDHSGQGKIYIYIMATSEEEHLTILHRIQPGRSVELFGALQRVDRFAAGDKETLRRNYSLVAKSYRIFRDGTLPTKESTERYRCDNVDYTATKCVYCAALVV